MSPNAFMDKPQRPANAEGTAARLEIKAAKNIAAVTHLAGIKPAH